MENREHTGVKTQNRFEMKIIALSFIIITCAAITQPIDAGTEVPGDTSFTVKSAFEKERAGYPFISIVQPQLPKGVAEERNLVYASYGSRKLHLDLFFPAEDIDKTYPAVILVHGGGWRSGDRSHQFPMAQRLAARGYVTAAVEYRLSPEALYPAAVHDLKASVRWMRANASEYDMVKKLEQFNIYYEIHTIPNTPHPFWLFHPWFEETVEHVANFLDITLKEKVQ